MRDHLCAGHQPWGRLLEVVEKHREALTFQKLSSISTVDGATLDLPVISRQLWCFLGPRLGDSLYSRRVQLAGGEDQNGLELWRKLFMEFEGGAETVALSGLRRFHGFPRCPSKEKLSTYLGHWQELRNRHGSLVPDQSQWVMLQHMLPEDVAKGARSQRQAPYNSNCN